MALCKWCRQLDEVPNDARPLSKGQKCKGCTMSYVEQRAKLSDDADLTDFGADEQ